MVSEDNTSTEKPKDIAGWIVHRSWTIGTLCLWFMIACWIPGLRLLPMQKRLRLSFSDMGIVGDFSNRAIEAEKDYYMLWCKACNLAEHEEYLEDQGRILRILQKVKEREHSCRDITWSTAEDPDPNMKPEEYWDQTGSVTLIPIDLGRTPEKCTHYLAGYLRSNVRGQESGDVKGGLASALALMEGSNNAVGKEVAQHQMILLPLMMVLLCNVVGGFWRCLTPLFISFWATVTSSFVLLELKYAFPDLQVGFMSNTIPFVCLAFSVDYAIFFWTRLEKERKARPAKEDYLECVAHAIRRVSEVIICSTVVMIAGFMCNTVYPNMNEYGYVACNIQLSTGVFFCGFYSLVTVPTWAAMFPSLYDNREPNAPTWLAALLPTVVTALPESKKFWRTWAGWVTRGYQMFIIPLLVFCAMIPLLVCFFKYEPNYDMLGLMDYDGIPESDAYHKMNDHFGASKSAKWMYVVNVHELGPAHQGAALLQTDDAVTASAQVQTAEEVAFAQHAMKMSRKANAFHVKPGHGTIMEKEVGEEVCKLSEKLLAFMKERHFKVNSEKIDGVWYGADPFHGKGKVGCRSQEDISTGLQESSKTFSDLFEDQIHKDGHKLIFSFYPGVESMGERSQHLYHMLRDYFEPEIAHEFEMNGKRYWFSAKHTSPISTIIEAQVECKRQCPLVCLLGCGVAFFGVATMFRALFLPFKFLLTVIIPIMSTCGLATAVFQENWFEWLGCNSLAQDGGVMWTVFYSNLGLMFGLAMDYDIFLFSRVYEFRHDGYDNLSSVQKGVVETGPVITSAGCFMMLSFWFMMVSGIRNLTQIAFLYFFGVMIDTFVIRTCIAPCVLCWGEVFNYWPGYIPPATKKYDVDSVDYDRDDDEK